MNYCLPFTGEIVVVSSHHVTRSAMTIKPTKTSLNSAAYPILGILSRGPAHGYDICYRLREGVGSIWRLGKSQVYALLIQLERDGLVLHERVGQENLPAKNVFRLTERGEEVFREWLDRPVDHIRDMRLEFLTKLWFAAQSEPSSESLLIEKQAAACRAKVSALVKLRSAAKTETESLSASFRLKLVEAAISWLEGLGETGRQIARTRLRGGKE